MGLSLNQRWWMLPEHNQARCRAKTNREDGRCHNLARQDGLCRVHLKVLGHLNLCKGCGRPVYGKEVS